MKRTYKVFYMETKRGIDIRICTNWDDRNRRSGSDFMGTIITDNPDKAANDLQNYCRQAAQHMIKQHGGDWAKGVLPGK